MPKFPYPCDHCINPTPHTVCCCYRPLAQPSTIYTPVSVNRPSPAEVEALNNRAQSMFDDDVGDITEDAMAYGDYEIDKARAEGFRDGLQSFILALRDSDTLDDALTTAMDAYENNS